MKTSIPEGIDREKEEEKGHFDAILAKNQIARMIRDRNVSFTQLRSCLNDIEKELGTINQPSVENIIRSDFDI